MITVRLMDRVFEKDPPQHYGAGPILFYIPQYSAGVTPKALPGNSIRPSDPRN